MRLKLRVECVEWSVEVGDLFTAFMVMLNCPPWNTAPLNGPAAGKLELFMNEDSQHLLIFGVEKLSQQTYISSCLWKSVLVFFLVFDKLVNRFVWRHKSSWLFSHPQKYLLALDKFELRTTRVHRKYYLVKAARQSYPRWPRKNPRKHDSLKPWFVIGRNDFCTCEKLVSPLWLVEVKSETLFHTAKFDAKISVCIK